MSNENSHKLYDKSERSQWTLDLSEKQKLKPVIKAESLDCEDVQIVNSEDRDSLKNVRGDINSEKSPKETYGVGKITEPKIV